MSSKKVLELTLLRAIAVLATILGLGICTQASDQVLDWVQVMNDTVLAGGTNPLFTSRVVALVSSSVFDAVNGIEPRYEPLLVSSDAPHPASPRAAAVEASYAVLVNQYPLQASILTDKRNASLAALAAFESAKSIQNGITWGDKAAQTVLVIRANDGFTPAPPPFLGVLGMTSSPSAIGAWRPTPTATLPTGGNAPGAGPQFATMTPWVLTRPSQFRLPPPFALTSAEYAADYNELKTMGALNGSGRTADQSQLVLFWAGNTALFWNRIARDLSMQRHLSLTQNAHLFALLNVTIADAAIACWDGKYRYVFWRPITAIRNGDLDGNPATDPDPNWQPFLDSHPIPSDRGTPAHPEYPSGHSTVSGAAAFVLSSEFGEDTPFSVISDALPGVTRRFASFSQATSEIADARVFGGIHFRTTCILGNALGRSVASYISSHAMLRRGEDRDDDE